MSLFVGPTVTVMKADSHLQIDPSTVYVKNVFELLESMGRYIAHGQHKNYA